MKKSSGVFLNLNLPTDVRLALLLGSALTSVFVPTTTWARSAAEDAASTDAPDPQAGGDIVVTALKRSTSLQKTPISMAAVTEQSLTHLGATSINDYFRQVPNLQVEGGEPTARRITIRGVRAAGEATVGLYYDETPLTGPNGAAQDAGSTTPDINLFDVERVEVLRGPQGTLYGSGSMGGTIRVIYNKANTARYEGTAEGQMTATKDGQPGFYTKGMINLPIVKDILGLRLVAYNEERGGFVDDVLLGRNNINSGRSYGGRALVTFTPTDRLTVNGSATYQKSVLDGQSGWYQRLGATSYSTDNRAIAKTSDELKMYNVTAKYDLDFATLTLTSSHYDWSLVRGYDYTTTLQASRRNPTACRNYFGQAGACTAAQLDSFAAYADSRLPAVLYQPMHLNSWNHEARLSGTAIDGLIDYTAGLYYEKRKDRIDSMVVLADADSGFPIQPLDLTAWRVVETSQRQTAAFGEITLHPTSKLSITGGARRFDYKKIVGGQVLVTNYITQSYAGAYSQVDASAKGWVSKFSANYELTPTVMVFASASKGFRPGGANNVPGLTSGLVTYGPDSLWNYEIGVKTQWFDRKLTLNATVYQIDWSNLQVSATSVNGAFSYLTNAGKARIRGAEVEATILPVSGLTIRAGFGYVDARLTQDQANSETVISGSTGLDGDRFPNVPKLSANASAEYVLPISDTTSLLLRGDFTHTGRTGSQFRPTFVNYDVQPSYQQVNLRTGIEQDGFGAYLFANNVLNEVGPLMVMTNSTAGNDQITSLRPRTIGLMFRKSF